MATYQEVIFSAINNALAGVDPATSPSLDATMVAETLFDEVAQSVSESAAADEFKRSLLRREKTVTLSAGAATLPSDVLTKYIADATLFNPSNLTKNYCWRDYPEFQRRSDPRLGVFTVRGGTSLLVRDPGQQFTVPLTAIGPRTLITPCVVVKPASATTAVDAADEIISDLIEALSVALKGELAKTAGAVV